MKIKYLLLISSLLLAGCQIIKPSGNNSFSSDITIPTGTSLSTSTQSSSDKSSSSSITPATSSSSSSSSHGSTSTTEGGRPILPCGNIQLDKPTNDPIVLETTNDNTKWYNQDMYESPLDDNWTFIYGDNSSKGPGTNRPQPSYYAYNSSNTEKYPGGIRFDQKTKGLQSPLFTHIGEKLEIRIGISIVKNCGDNAETSKDTGYIYCYDSNGNFMPDKIVTVQRGTIDTSKEGSYIRYYVKDAQEVAYFEFRLNAMPYKSDQCYNFGVGYISVHSWPQN